MQKRNNPGNMPIGEMVARNRAGDRVGLPCFCSANESVLRAVLSHAAAMNLPVVIEATCNQVNQDGGYTGMTPGDFIQWVGGMAAEYGVVMDMDGLILGGDHLGPNPWKAEPAASAMAKAREMVRLYAEAGFTKIHLDTSMPCGGEAHPDFALVAARAAELCAVAEAHAPDPGKLIYVIGTEVPAPGGEGAATGALDVTPPARFMQTVATHRQAWAQRGLDAAWRRIIAVVTQPGVDFGNQSVHAFVPGKARPLREAILAIDNLVFEAHSTDYQTDRALAGLVQAGFFFLKVGPELTFKFREAVFALAEVESKINPGRQSRIREIINARMDANPVHWKDYYTGDAREVARLKEHGLSDRIRYYWSDAEVAAAFDALMHALEKTDMPEARVARLLSDSGFDTACDNPRKFIEKHVQRSIARYYAAAGYGGEK